MRSYCAIYVDAGYLLAASATRVTGTSLRRGVRVDHAALIHGLIAQAEAESGLPLLRVNWYDSGGRPGGMPDLQQDHIGMLPRVKLRLGRLSQTGEQKGVDLRMGLDLATYARNRVVDAIYLVSGDDDLTEAVEEAQFHGLQLVILAVPDDRGRPHAVAKNLQREADGVILIEAQTIDANVKSLALDPALIPQGEPAAAPDKAGALPEGRRDRAGRGATGPPADPRVGSSADPRAGSGRPRGTGGRPARGGERHTGGGGEATRRGGGRRERAETLGACRQARDHGRGRQDPAAVRPDVVDVHRGGRARRGDRRHHERPDRCRRAPSPGLLGGFGHPRDARRSAPGRALHPRGSGPHPAARPVQPQRCL